MNARLEHLKRPTAARLFSMKSASFLWTCNRNFCGRSKTARGATFGFSKSFRVDVRVIAATNRKLEEEVAAGRFREDLLHRLNIVTVELPPLRRRPSDIEELALHFISAFSPAGETVDLSPSALEKLKLMYGRAIFESFAIQSSGRC